MNLVNGLLQHMILALTFRHKLTGLAENNVVFFAFIVILSSLIAYVRFDSLGFIIIHPIILVLIGLIVSPRFAIVCGIISIGIDLIGILYFLVTGEVNNMFLEFWQIAAIVRAFFVEKGLNLDKN